VSKRTVLHFDLDAFFCSVEERLDPALRGRAFVVGGRAETRGVVASASYAARKFGVRSAMPTAHALRLCPDLLVLSGRHRLYGEASDEVMAFVREAAPVVEQISIDEAFLDVRDDPQPGREVAAGLKTTIRSRFDLPSSWGVATNKLVAKIATEVGKPDGLVVVPPGEEAGFLAPLPVEMLWGVGPKTREHLAQHGVRTIGELAALSPDQLRPPFGERGLELASSARGIDDREVVSGHEPRSMSSETTFARDVLEASELRRTLRHLSEEVGARLREEGLAGSTVRLKIRWPDFTTMTRQRRLASPTDMDDEIYQASLDLFLGEWRTGRPVRLLGVGVAQLGAPVRQLSLFDRSWERDERLLDAIDRLRARYGWEAVRRAGDLGRKSGRRNPR
jgi:DNA polymerase-4